MSEFNISGLSRVTGSVGGVERLSESRGVDTKIKTEESSGSSTTFGDLLKDALQNANKDQLNADSATQELIAGRSRDLHGTVLAVEKADISFRLLTQVHNKVLDAYREIMKMQV